MRTWGGGVCEERGIILPTLCLQVKIFWQDKKQEWEFVVQGSSKVYFQNNCILILEGMKMFIWSKWFPRVGRRESQTLKVKGRRLSFDAETEAPVLWPPDAKSWLTEKEPEAGKDWRRKEEMVGGRGWDG